MTIKLNNKKKRDVCDRGADLMLIIRSCVFLCACVCACARALGVSCVAEVSSSQRMMLGGQSFDREDEKRGQAEAAGR